MKKISFGKISFSAAGSSKDGGKNNGTSQDAGALQGFGSFGRKEANTLKDTEDVTKIDTEDDEMARIMGFGSFGGKKAKQFDINAVLKDTLETAVERNKDNIGEHHFLPFNQYISNVLFCY